MADLSKIKLNGTTYNFKDAWARTNLQTASQVQTAITTALGNISEFEISVVQTLPTAGESGTFYFVSNTQGSENNIYDEYVYVNNSWEKIGTTEIDLSNYLQSSDIADWAKAATKPAYTANEVGALPDTTIIPSKTSDLTNDSGFITSYTDTKVEQAELSDSIIIDKAVLLSNDNNSGNTVTGKAYKHDGLYYNPYYKRLTVENIQLGGWAQPGNITIGGVKLTSVAEGSSTITFPITTGTVALTSDIPSVPSWALQSSKPTYTASEVGALSSSTVIPSKTSDLTNDSGYLTASDIASVMTYKGTKANYAALPSTGNTTGDVWHLTDTGAEWAWDGSAWQELGTAIDLSGYATKATTLAGYGITDAKIQNGTITLGSNTITPLTSYTETDPVFSASAAAGITSTDINNWNANISDDKTWNGVSLTTTQTNTVTLHYIPAKTSTTLSGDAIWFKATPTPTNHAIAKWDGNSYLYSTTPSANDNSTKVATTAYVDAAITTGGGSGGSAITLKTWTEDDIVAS